MGGANVLFGVPIVLYACFIPFIFWATVIKVHKDMHMLNVESVQAEVSFCCANKSIAIYLCVRTVPLLGIECILLLSFWLFRQSNSWTSDPAHFGQSNTAREEKNRHSVTQVLAELRLGIGALAALFEVTRYLV